MTVIAAAAQSDGPLDVTAKVKTVAPMSASLSEGLSVSSDDRFLFFSQHNEAGTDLMLVENFE
jgi:hypothetical protein